MRKYTRPALGKRPQAYLDKKAGEIQCLPSPAAKKQAVARKWKQARQTRTVGQGVFGVLRNMAGKRERCMYCEDSRGTDIDHFWPKSVYPQRTFDWPNMLLSCSGCQRAKGNKFPLDKAGEPELIDPTADDPWGHLYYVSETGVVTARYDAQTGRESRKGLATTALLPLNDEAIACGRRRASRRLKEAVRAFLDAGMQGFARTSEADAAEGLRKAARDCPDYGLAQWYFVADGRDEEPFRALQANHPALFEELSNAVSSGDP